MHRAPALVPPNTPVTAFVSSSLSKARPRFRIVAGLLLLAALGARAASVGAGGYTNDFNSQPAAADFATATIAGTTGEVIDAAGMDAAVALLTAAGISTQLPLVTGSPPAASGTAGYNDTGKNLQTRPTGVKMAVIMARLTNNSGASATSVTLGYDLIQHAILAEEVPRFRVYYSLTGAASSWTHVPAWSATNSGTVNSNVTLASSWNVGSPLYLLFADENGSSSPDTANQIDNFSFGVSGPAVQLPVAIASQPQNITVNEGQPATFAVVAGGNPPTTFQWYRGAAPIAGATNASYTLVGTLAPDNGALFSVVAANVASNLSYSATSSVALLTVIADIDPPVLLGAQLMGLNNILLSFSESISETTATNLGHYVLTNSSGSPFVITTAAFSGSQSNVLLAFTPAVTEGFTNFIVVNGIRDQSFAANLLANAPVVTVVALENFIFQITSLTANNSLVVDHNALTGDDRGGIAVSTSRVLIPGDGATASYAAADLTGGVSLGRNYDGMATDLRTETVYVLGDGTNLLTSIGGTVTTLLRLNSATGQPDGQMINLSQSFFMPPAGNGIFSGYGRVVVQNDTRVYDIYVPSGTVTDRGSMTRPNWQVSESWSVWGVAEYFGGALYLTGRESGTQRIIRARVLDGAVTAVATFSDLSDLASFTVSPSRGRWYFHYELGGQFGGTQETLGYADATFAIGPAPTISAPPTNVTVNVGGLASFSVTAAGPAPLSYQWRKDGVNIPGAVASSYNRTNVQPASIGNYSVAVSNAGGSVTSSMASLTIPGVTSGLWQGLVAYYPFNGNANDESGFGNHGTPSGAVLAADRNLAVNSSYNFNGSSASIQVPAAPAFNFSSNDFAIFCWINPAGGGFPTILNNGNSTGPTTVGFEFSLNYPSAGNLSWVHGNSSADWWGAGSVGAGTWSLVGVTCSNGTERLWINGTLTATRTSPRAIGVSSSPLLIGAAVVGQELFNGSIDDIRIYNRPLSSNEVFLLFASEALPTSVAITGPTNTQNFAAGVAITVDAAVAGSVTNVAFYADGGLIGNDASSPYSLVYSNATVGAHTLTAVAKDTAGLSVTSTVVNITVTLVTPTVAITAPANAQNFQLGAGITINASVTGGVLTNVSFYRDGGVLIGSDAGSPFSVVYSGATVGAHTLTAVVQDNLGQSATSSVVNITVTVPVPTVVITAPANGQSFQPGTDITINASATGAGLTNVNFYRDGGVLIGSDVSSPFSLVYSNASLGGHTLTAVVQDNSGQSATSSVVNLTVSIYTGPNAPAGDLLKLVTQRGYLPQNPVLVRVELLTPAGQRDRDVWDIDVTLTSDQPGVTLSTNKIALRNGLGSALVTFTGGGDFNLTAAIGSLSTNRPLQSLAAVPVTTIGGTLPGTSTTWSNVVNVTNALTVPVGHTLTILPNTLVLINGLASSSSAPGFTVLGGVQSLGTEDQPVTFTCATSNFFWGQILHSNPSLASSALSIYRHTMVTKAGNSPAVGHTSTGPAFRLINASNIFEHCTVSDHKGKIMQAEGSDLQLTNCQLARSIMGPEIGGTAIKAYNTWITEMHGTPTAPEGTNDNDGIYLHGQQGGQIIRLQDCVVADCQDDGIDTLGSTVTITNCIIRDCTNVNEDAKGISGFDSTITVQRSLIVNNLVSVSMKTSGGAVGRVNISDSTITGIQRGVAAAVKANAPGPIIDYRITNCIIVSTGAAVYTDFGATNFTIGYTHMTQPWPGTGNLSGDPLFVNVAANDYHLLPASPAIDTGDPTSPLDPNGTRADMGYHPFTGFLLVAFTAPANGSVVRGPTNLTLSAVAVSTGTVTKVEFYEGVTLLGEDTGSPFSLVWSNVAVGGYTLTAVATDNGGNLATSSPVAITVVSNFAPSVALTTPANNAVFTVPANIRLAASASDSDGTIDKVEFFQGATKLGEDTGSPYNLTWSNVAVGIYSLTAVATDNASARQTSAPVNITVTGGGPTTNTLVALGSIWQYLDNGSNQGTNWSQPGFSNNWATGLAPLGYCTSTCSYSLVTPTLLYGPDPSAKYPTTYFLRTFIVEDPARVTGLLLNSLADDGAVFYINGREAFRYNMPGGTVNYLTLALSAGNHFPVQNTLPAGLLTALVPGTNILAVEIHQGSGSSSDIVLDARLDAVLSAATNFPPLVSLSSPANNTTVDAPANVTLTALASASGGTVTNVAFRVNGALLAEDTSSPYTFAWNSVAAGSYALTAVATDSTGLAATSSVVNITVSTDIAPPVIAGQSPAPGTVTNLTQMAVTFSKIVLGVNAADILINGAPAGSVTGSGSNYTFTFPQPAYGVVTVTWAAAHGIGDIFTPPHPFDTNSAGASWQYQFIDVLPPVIAVLDPIAGPTVSSLTTITVTFNEPVTGVQAADLLINAAPATTLSGTGAGPYVFGFAQPTPGLVSVSWAAGHGLQDLSGNNFAGGAWTYGLDTTIQDIVISEIMYHPASENVLEEWIELFNKSGSVVNLNGWRFSSGVSFTFTNVTIPAGGRLVVAANLAAFAIKFPGITNVTGNWTGTLNNTSDGIDLEDAAGRPVDSVRYADEGDWAVRRRGVFESGFRGWEWLATHDGLGRSLELVNPNLANNNGQNWAASRVTNGTPGLVNSVLTNNLPPMILDASHFPFVPNSTNTVLVTARIVDESPGGLSVTLFSRIDAVPTNIFAGLAMTDDGLGGDAVAGDGLYTATLPAQPNNTVIEFYLRATDVAGATRTWPAPAIAAADGAGPTGQVVNALYQVDNTPFNPASTQPLYKLIMTESERAELQAIPGFSSLSGPNSAMNGTFISLDGTGVSLHYNADFRNRGHGSRTVNPPNYRVGFRTDDPWKGVSAINLNSVNVHVQHLGSIVARYAGVAGADTIAAQVRINNVNRASGGAGMFGSYAANEVQGGDWAKAHFPLDGAGNVYRVVRDQNGLFDYRGTNPVSYTTTWFKQSNVSENDYSDLIGMLSVVGINNPASFTTENVRQVVNVEQWMRHLALMNLMGNAESGLNTGYNDDYLVYRGVNDPRFILTYYDLDSILGEASLASNSDLFSATTYNGSGQAFDRFMHWPDFEPIYFQTLQNMLATTFAKTSFDTTVDQALGGYVASGTIANIKSWMDARRAFVQSQLTGVTNFVPPVAVVSAAPRSPTPLTDATFTVSGANGAPTGSNVVSYRFQLNGGGYGAEILVANEIELAGLAAGTNTVAVIAKDASGLWQSEAAATIRSWIVNPAWPSVRLNEVLARNVAALNHAGTFPDAVELYNEGGSTVDLSGLRLTDDPSAPDKFTFPGGTTLPGGGYLVVFANNPDATPGLHLGFSLDQTGEGVYLFDRASNGPVVLDSVAFGMQLANFSLGRLTDGNWVLTQPTFGTANTVAALGDPRHLKINEWLAEGVTPNPDDFIELYNPDALPVALGGLHLTDQPIGVPALSTIRPLTFLGAGGFVAFFADGNSGPDHVNFKLNIEQGEIGLTAVDGSIIDHVIYGPQQPGVSSGRCPDGAVTPRVLGLPTPGSLNACPFVPTLPVATTLLSISNVWSYHAGTNLDAVNWTTNTFNDSSWSKGPALLGRQSFAGGQSYPEPFRTLIETNAAQPTFYFRAHFNLAPGTAFTSLQIRHIIDDGAVFYLNGVEIPGTRFNMAGGAVTAATLAPSAVSTATYQGPFGTSVNLLLTGDNVFAVEVHQSSAGSSDLAMGVELSGLIFTNSPALAAVVINEVLANNATLAEPDGSTPDWVEIYNPSSNAVDLATMSLTDSTLTPQRWVFPAGSILPAQGFLKVRLDAGLPASATNTGFGLKANGGSVYLYHRPADGGSLASAVIYGLQAADWSIGRVPNGSTNWVLNLPTFGSGNIAATLGDPAQLKINEWMAAPASGNDWFEVFNPNAQPVSLSQLWLSDDLAARQKYQIPALSFIGTGPEGYFRFWAANGADPDFTGFSLRNAGEALAISTANGPLINGLTFGAQSTGISQGRLPDGAVTILSFPTTSTPGKPNFLPLTTVVVNEVLAHTDPPLEDAVEFYNPTGDAVDISGWYLSDSQNNLLKYRIPSNTLIQAGSYVVIYEYQFNLENIGTPLSFSSAKGDEVYLSQATAPGVLTGWRAYATFDASENGVSFGRHQTSVGVDFTALGAHTFGVDNPATTNQFRLGTGLTNAYPKVGPVVLNEIMYHPPGTNDTLEFVELQNILGSPVPLFDPANPANTWRLRKGVDFNFPQNTTIPPGGFLAVVSFDPLTDPASLAVFQAAYGTNATLVGPYSGKLDNNGETIELQKPDAPQTTPGPDFGFVPYIVVDRVTYGDAAPWPVSPDGTGDSLKRISAGLYGNDPVNWYGGAPTPGAVNGLSNETNTPPVLNPIGGKTVTEGTLLAFTVTAVDTNVPLQILTFSLDAPVPSGASITAGGAFTWTPTEAQGPGVYSVTVRVTDSGSPVLSSTETISITVNETNAAPVLNPIGNKVVNEGGLVTFTATGSDSDVPVQTLTYSLEAGAPAAAGITTGGLFNWTPGEADGPGVYSVTVRVTDNGVPARDASETITITVNEVNTAPGLVVPGPQTIDELTTLTVTNTATDADLPANGLTFALVSAPAGVNLHPSTGVLTWTPTEAQGPGTNVITLRVFDNGPPSLATTQSFTVIVNDVNSAPALTVPGTLSLSVLNTLTVTNTASDSDLPAQTLTFALVSAPSGVSLDSTNGVLTWTPSLLQTPSTNIITLSVTDDGSPSLSTTQSFTVFVSDENVPPLLTVPGPQTLDELTTLTVTNTATDANLPPQLLTFALLSAPAGVNLDAATGVLTWTPTEAQGPTNAVITLRVSDNGVPSLSTTQSFNVTVNEVNLAPALTVPGPQTISALSTLTVTNLATDPDLPAQTLIFALVSAPGGVNVNPGSGVLTWTPTLVQAPSTNTIVVRVTDNGPSNLSATQSFQVIVTDLNFAPVLAAIGNKSVTEGSLLTFTATATDSNQPSQTIAFTLDAGAPAGAAINPTNGVFTWTPTLAQGPSNYTVTVRVTDSGAPALDGFETITITVLDPGVRLSLLKFTNSWKYIDTGVDLGTTWKNTAFDDTAWPAGLGVLFNETAIIPEPKNTPLALNTGGGVHITTFYFRTHFHLPAAPTGLTLTATNLIDDGAIYYINGVEAGRYNMPAGGVNSATFAASSVEATSYVVTTLSPASIVSGDNVLAVEIHQQSAASSDVVFGMSLTALAVGQAPVVITGQPINTTVTVGAPVQFTVAASGASLFHQWRKNGAPINGATNATFNLAAAQLSDADTYSVIVSNLVNSVTSASAVLTVNSANTAPSLAVITNRTVTEGTTVSFTASATDADLPAQTLTYSLDADFPAGADIHPGSGLFTWTPAVGHVPATNAVTVRVTDSGVPPAAATRSFQLVVVRTPRILDLTRAPNGNVTLRWESFPGKTYLVQSKDDLASGSWTNHGAATPAAGIISTVIDPLVAGQQRFYQVLLLD